MKEVIKIGKYEGETIWLTKHTWACDWYWGFGYLGNKDCHFHFDSYLGRQEHTAKELGLETWLSEKQWWILRDLFVSAYALKKAAEVYHYGGHQTSDAAPYRIISEEMENRINADLEKILNNLWNLLLGWKEAHDKGVAA